MIKTNKIGNVAGTEWFTVDELRDAIDSIQGKVSKSGDTMTGNLEAPSMSVSGVPVATMPIGSIIMFSGFLANISNGWALCDGSNDTVNLEGRFVLGTTFEIGNPKVIPYLCLNLL